MTGLAIGSFFACAAWASGELALRSQALTLRAISEYALTIWLVSGLPTAALVGPLFYSALKHRVRPSALNCALAGAAVAATPWIIFLLLVSMAGLSEGKLPDFSGEPTLAASIAAAGSLGGLVFYLVAVATRQPHRPLTPP